MMSFEEEYQMHVKIEAESIVEDVRDYTEHHHYETDLFFDDVIRLVRKLIAEEKRGKI